MGPFILACDWLKRRKVPCQIWTPSWHPLVPKGPIVSQTIQISFFQDVCKLVPSMVHGFLVVSECHGTQPASKGNKLKLIENMIANVNGYGDALY